VAMYSSAQDLVDKTAGFWEQYVRQKLERDFNGLYHFLNEPYPKGPNFYVQRVEANMLRLRKMIVRTHKF